MSLLSGGAPAGGHDLSTFLSSHNAKQGSPQNPPGELRAEPAEVVPAGQRPQGRAAVSHMAGL